MTRRFESTLPSSGAKPTWMSLLSVIWHEVVGKVRGGTGLNRRMIRDLSTTHVFGYSLTIGMLLASCEAASGQTQIQYLDGSKSSKPFQFNTEKNYASRIKNGTLNWSVKDGELQVIVDSLNPKNKRWSAGRIRVLGIEGETLFSLETGESCNNFLVFSSVLEFIGNGRYQAAVFYRCWRAYGLLILDYDPDLNQIIEVFRNDQLTSRLQVGNFDEDPSIEIICSPPFPAIPAIFDYDEREKTFKEKGNAHPWIYDEEIKNLNGLLELDPKEFRSAHYKACLNLGLIFGRLGRYEKARKYLEDAKSLVGGRGGGSIEIIENHLRILNKKAAENSDN